MFTMENFINGIQIATNIITKTEGDKLTLIRRYRTLENPEGERVIFGKIDLTEIEAISTKLKNEYSWSETILLDATSFEIAVQMHGRSFGTGRGPYTVSEHNYKITLSKSSKEYVFALICHYATKSDYDINFIYQRDFINCIEDLFERFHIYTVKISSNKKHSVAEFKHMLHSYLFNISYNYNITFSIVDFSESRRAFRRRARRGGQLFPYKSYNQELTKYYHQAMATDIPFTQYLAFYHVAEFFFQSISEHDAFQEIENFITRPSFSPYKKEDIKSFYNMIKKKMRDQRDDGVWDEKTGLLLCLEKYIPNIESLKSALKTIDASAIDYYKNSLVEFADNSTKIDFDDDEKKIYADIRNRVYSVRNAIVHSKESDKLRYEPFKHDRQLVKEIPLIRSIAEEIIINSAKPIEYNLDD